MSERQKLHHAAEAVSMTSLFFASFVRCSDVEEADYGDDDDDHAAEASLTLLFFSCNIFYLIYRRHH